jgi:hypothetical protein
LAFTPIAVVIGLQEKRLGKCVLWDEVNAHATPGPR